MCCSRKPRDENIIRAQSKKPSNYCWGQPEEDGWTEGKDNIGFKNQNNKNQNGALMGKPEAHRKSSARNFPLI